MKLQSSAPVSIDNADKEQFLSWLYGLSVHGIKLGLRNITELLERLGNPQEAFSSVHVAGTDGKGSVCAIISAVLIDGKVRTGTFTSPHILNFNERITVDGVPITDEELACMASVTVPHVKAMAGKGMLCTFFEVTTAIAFLYFKEKGVEYAVVEVGMGGRFDATNVIVPEVSIINNISLEHTEYLGNTIEEIAFEKAGIIKEGVPCVTINPEPALSVIRKVAEERRSPLTRINPDDISVISVSAEGTEFTYKEEKYFVSIPGRHQARNASIAIEALSKLKIYGHRCRCRIKPGLSKINWPCRMQRVEGTPFIVDVSHTFAGSSCLSSDIRDIYGKVLVVFGILGDKDIEHVSKNISDIASRIILTKPDSVRAAPLERISEIMAKYSDVVAIRESVGDAMDLALSIREPDELILVTGSFYMAGDALKWLEKTYPGSSTRCLRSMKAEHTPEGPRKD